jgi:hypothetical protein
MELAPATVPAVTIPTYAETRPRFLAWLANPTSGWAMHGARLSRPVVPGRGSYKIADTSLQRLQAAALACDVAGSIPGAASSPATTDGSGGSLSATARLSQSHVGWCFSRRSIELVLEHLREVEHVKSPRMYQMVDCTIKLLTFMAVDTRGSKPDADLLLWLRRLASRVSAHLLYFCLYTVSTGKYGTQGSDDAREVSKGRTWAWR